MHIIITGATGFIGSALCSFWLARGHEITALVRNKVQAAVKLGADVRLITSFDEIDPSERFDAAVNLAGAPIAAQPWTKKRRCLLRNSRLDTTNELVRLIDRLKTKPHTVISASATGYYGRCGDTWLAEDTPPQNIFMSQLCRRWEKAAAPVTQHGCRLVTPRISVVLGTDGGAFLSLVRPVRLGLGAVLGSGEQYFPWIHKTDLIRLFDHFLENKDINGPVNAAAPEAITQKAFNRLLAKKLRRPVILWVPASFLKLLLGEMADLFVAGQRLSAKKALTSGFSFQYGALSDAFDDLLA